MNEEKRNEKYLLKYKKEIIMTSFFLVIAIISILIINLTAKMGSTVEVTVGGEIVATYSLTQNGEYPILGGKNILIIKDGEAYLSYADCPDLVCIKTGRISRVGESIICLPNKLAVTVRGVDNNAPDLIS